MPAMRDVAGCSIRSVAHSSPLSYVLPQRGRDGDGHLTDEEIDELFAHCDTDNNGYVDEQELTGALVEKVGAGASKLVAKQMIALTDKDESGTVDKEELRDLLKKLAKTMNW